MKPVKVTFIISQLTEEEVEVLKNDNYLISKMILSADDYGLFHYKEGELIQVETSYGNRLWCKINHLEVVKDEDRVILIFTLTQANLDKGEKEKPTQ